VAPPYGQWAELAALRAAERIPMGQTRDSPNKGQDTRLKGVSHRFIGGGAGQQDACYAPTNKDVLIANGL